MAPRNSGCHRLGDSTGRHGQVLPQLLHLGDPVLIQITNSEFYSEVPVTSMLKQPFLNQFKQIFKYCPEVYSLLVMVRREKAFITIMFFIWKRNVNPKEKIEKGQYGKKKKKNWKAKLVFNYHCHMKEQFKTTSILDTNTKCRHVGLYASIWIYAYWVYKRYCYCLLTNHFHVYHFCHSRAMLHLPQG